MKKTLTFGAITAIAIGVAVAMYVFRGHEETADVEPAFTVTCDNLVQEFLDDETAATAKYVEQVVQVSGPVLELTKTDGNVTGVKIATDEFYVVNASFQEAISAESIPEGTLNVKGIVSGFLGDPESMLPGGTVELKRSALVQ